jgi:hypothetical protein
MIYSQVLNKGEVAIPASAAITPALRVSIVTNEAAVAGNDTAGVGVAQGFDGTNVVIRPRIGGKSAVCIASGAITAFDLLYAATNGRVASTGTIPLGYALEGAGDGEAVVILWTDLELSTILAAVPS